ncbi:MAG TPA: hypothetical protein PLU22_07000, partial [Polyangiaceae bacterium]|nr:hypothetical protein [Polyangiaceae bacterium]
VLADRAMRNTRVLVRRARAVVDQAEAEQPVGALASMAALVHELRLGVDELGAVLASGGDPAAVRERLARAASSADPYVVAPEDWHVQSLVMLVRSLVVDLEEAAGVGPEEARGWLPEL